MNKLLLLFTLFFVSIAIAQKEDVPFDKQFFEDRKEEFNRASKEIKKGDFHFFDGSISDLSNALGHYLKAQDFNPYSSVLNFKIGVCYLNSSRKFNALKHLKLAYEMNPEVDQSIKFYLAQAYHLHSDFDQAIVFYGEFKDEIIADDQSQRFFLDKKIQECRTGKEIQARPVRVWIDNLGDSINTEYPEFSPIISADNRTLFFTARRPDSKGGKIDKTGYYYEDIYISKRDFDGDWTLSQNLGDRVNTETHDATVGLGPDGKSLLTYKGMNSKNGDVLITRQSRDGTWKKPQSLGESINTKHHESSASLSFDEKTLYFVSDQPNGFGQHDIYVAYWDEETGQWGEPKNLGPTINTEFEEKGVFFHSDNKTLYFSSNGHNNIGGLDIFVSVFDSETGEWSKPENIGYPINTPDDDIYFVVTGNERYAYYSSFREDGFGEKDIYKITFLGEKKLGLLAEASLMDTDFIIEETGTIVENFADNGSANRNVSSNANNKNSDENNIKNKKTTDNVKSKKMIIKGSIIEGKTKNGISSVITVINTKTKEKKEITSNPDGSYEIPVEAGYTYEFTVSSFDHTVSSLTITTSKKDANSEKMVDFQLNPRVVGETFTLRNIYFDFNGYSLRDKFVEDLNQLANMMKENSSMVVELGGHTDTRGKRDYNQILSTKRAQVAKDYLIKKGISASRIQIKGYGETKPEISDLEIDKLKERKAKAEAHQQNRRTTVTVIHE